MSVSNVSALEDTGYFFELYENEISEQLPRPEALEQFVCKTPLKDRIQLLQEEPKRSTYCIDHYLNAKVPSDAFRLQAIKHWQPILDDWTAKQKETALHAQKTVNRYKLFATSFALIGGCSILLAIANLVTLAAAEIFFIGADLAATFFFAHKAIQATSKMKDEKARYQVEIDRASSQLSQWQQSPPESIALKRTEAYQKGFPHIYSFPAIRKTLLSSETVMLFEKYRSDRLMQLLSQKPFSDSQKMGWLKQFETLNPLSQDLLKCAYNSIPEAYLTLSKEFEEISKALQATRDQAAKKTADQQLKATQQLNNIARQKKQRIAPLKSRLDRQLEEAKKKKQLRIAQLETMRQEQIGKQSPAQISQLFDYLSREITATYQTEIDLLEANFDAAILPINLSAEEQTRDVENRRDLELQKIEQQQTTSLLTFYDKALALTENSIKKLS